MSAFKSFNIEQAIRRATAQYRESMGLPPECDVCGYLRCRCHDEPPEPQPARDERYLDDPRHE